MSHALDLQVSAEGIETIDPLDLLRAKGCDRGQGYFFSPAVHPDILWSQPPVATW